MTDITLSVREFAQPLQRSGHIEQAFTSIDPMRTGSELHLEVQARMRLQDSTYRSEVGLSCTFATVPYSIQLDGRADGIYDLGDGRVIIEEIKTTHSLEGLQENLYLHKDHPYWLQVFTYSKIYRLLNADTKAVPKLRLVHARNRQEIVLELDSEIYDYEAWFDQRCLQLAELLKASESNYKRRLATSTALVFPFSSDRPSQIQLMQKIENAVTHHQQLLVQAPTGLGKTAASLFPTLKVALSNDKKIVYITPKNTQHDLAVEFVRALNETSEYPVRAMTIRAKSKACMLEEPICSAKVCPYALNFYDKLTANDLLNKLTAEPILTPEVFQWYAKTYEVCPFELSLEVAKSSNIDLVVCDYNYVFAPRVALDALKTKPDGASSLNYLLIDEAHNLPSRLCDYASPMIDIGTIENATQIDWRPQCMHLRDSWQELMAQCSSLIAAHASPQQSRGLVKLDEESFWNLERSLQKFVMRYLDATRGVHGQDPVLNLWRRWREFCAAMGNERSFVTFRHDTPTPSLKITAWDAAALGAENFKCFSSVVAFSATLKPFDYFAKICGFTDYQTIELDSPFDQANRKILIVPQISTRFQDRAKSLNKLKDFVQKVVGLRQGNYFVFFPSYEYLNLASQVLTVPGYRILKQTPHMTSDDAQDLISGLKHQSRRVIVLGVMGGVFSEGIDYPGDILIGAIIVGPALPGFDFEREKLRDIYGQQFGDGFNYAYVYPGMTRVIQAAGRVIRTEKDRGIICLLDERFLRQEFAASMPRSWFENSPTELVSRQILQDLQNFWEEKVTAT